MPTPEKDRWHELADAILNGNHPASDKALYRFMLDKADYKTAVLPERFTPTQRVMARKTSLSLRQVKYSLQHLALHGWLEIREAENDGRRRTYVLKLGASCACTERRHVADPSATNSLSATPSATEKKVQRRRSAPAEADGRANVARVADSSAATQAGLRSTGDYKGDDTTDRQRKVQPEGQKGATPALQIGATDRCNAAGQPPTLTERQREEDLKDGGETIAQTWDLTRQLRRCARCQERAAGRGGILCTQCQADIAAANCGTPTNVIGAAPTYQQCTRCKIRGYYRGTLCPTCQRTEEPSEQWPPHFGPELAATGTWG